MARLTQRLRYECISDSQAKRRQCSPSIRPCRRCSPKGASMRFRHGELEDLREDVSAWVAKKKASTSGRRMSYKHATRMGIYRLHRGDTVSQATKYLEGFLDSYSLKSAQKREECEADLHEYARWLKKE